MDTPGLVQFPPALQFLFEPHRYKILHGGRGGTKSWGIARALLTMGAKMPLRILCARETQRSIADSVHKLLSDQVIALGLQSFYTVQQNTIMGRNGTEFIFAGLKHNVANIKSLEACDIVWVEEAQTTSKDSWETLIPTIRKDKSEIWVSFNPMLDTDDTYYRFVLNPPSTAKVVKLTWRDNPWFPEVLRIEMEELKRKDPAAYAHVYEGDTKSAVEGAIYAAEIAQAEADRRITSVGYDRTRPVHTFWDLGFGDRNCIWFAQTQGETLAQGSYRFIDYIENEQKTIEWYIIQLNMKGYEYGIHYVPHDATDTIIHGKLAGDRTRSIDQLMRNAGLNVRIVPKMHVATGINAARTIFPFCWFDANKCADGLQGLRHYQWGPVSSSGVEKRAPLHNWASHPADGFRGAAVSLKHPEKPPQARTVPPARVGAWS